MDLWKCDVCNIKLNAKNVTMNKMPRHVCLHILKYYSIDNTNKKSTRKRCDIDDNVSSEICACVYEWNIGKHQNKF